MNELSRRPLSDDPSACAELLEPNCDGVWLWKERGDWPTLTLVLTANGCEVASIEGAGEDTPQYYWEQTETTTKAMPGLWTLVSPRSKG